MTTDQAKYIRVLAEARKLQAEAAKKAAQEAAQKAEEPPAPPPVNVQAKPDIPLLTPNDTGIPTGVPDHAMPQVDQHRRDTIQRAADHLFGGNTELMLQEAKRFLDNPKSSEWAQLSDRDLSALRAASVAYRGPADITMMTQEQQAAWAAQTVTGGKRTVTGVDASGQPLKLTVGSVEFRDAMNTENPGERLDKLVRLGIYPAGTTVISDVDAFNKKFGTNINPNMPYAVPVLDTFVTLKSQGVINEEGRVSRQAALEAVDNNRLMDALVSVGYDRKKLTEYGDSIKTLNPYSNPDGTIDLVAAGAAINAGNESVRTALERMGVSTSDIQEGRDIAVQNAAAEAHNTEVMANSTKLPDGTYIKNDALERLKTENPAQYDILTSKGFKAYQDEYNEALSALEPYRNKDGTYDLFDAMKSAQNTLNTYYSDRPTSQEVSIAERDSAWALSDSIRLLFTPDDIQEMAEKHGNALTTADTEAPNLWREAVAGAAITFGGAQSASKGTPFPWDDIAVTAGQILLTAGLIGKGIADHIGKGDVKPSEVQIATPTAEGYAIVPATQALEELIRNESLPDRDRYLDELIAKIPPSPLADKYAEELLKIKGTSLDTSREAALTAQPGISVDDKKAAELTKLPGTSIVQPRRGDYVLTTGTAVADAAEKVADASKDLEEAESTLKDIESFLSRQPQPVIADEYEETSRYAYLDWLKKRQALLGAWTSYVASVNPEPVQGKRDGNVVKALALESLIATAPDTDVSKLRASVETATAGLTATQVVRALQAYRQNYTRALNQGLARTLARSKANEAAQRVIQQAATATATATATDTATDTTTDTEATRPAARTAIKSAVKTRVKTATPRMGSRRKGEESSGEKEDDEKLDKIRRSDVAITYRRGELSGKGVWHTYTYDKGRGWERVITLGQSPSGAHVTDGPGSVARTLQRVGKGKKLPPININADTGAIDDIVYTSPDGRLKIEHVQDDKESRRGPANRKPRRPAQPRKVKEVNLGAGVVEHGGRRHLKLD